MKIQLPKRILRWANLENNVKENDLSNETSPRD